MENNRNYNNMIERVISKSFIYKNNFKLIFFNYKNDNFK